MKFECDDLDRALKTHELMADAKAHAAECPRCRRELYLWTEISRVAPELHEEWDSPELWPRIRQALAAEARPARKTWLTWQWATAAAAVAVVLLAILLVRPWAPAGRSSREFLTDAALRDVETAETAYARSIERLAKLAEPEIERSSTPLAASYREKLLLLDGAIAEVKDTVDRNRYNTHLRTELGALYREKQKTLQDWLQQERN